MSSDKTTLRYRLLLFLPLVVSRYAIVPSGTVIGTGNRYGGVYFFDGVGCWKGEGNGRPNNRSAAIGSGSGSLYETTIRTRRGRDERTQATESFPLPSSSSRPRVPFVPALPYGRCCDAAACCLLLMMMLLLLLMMMIKRIVISKYQRFGYGSYVLYC